MSCFISKKEDDEGNQYREISCPGYFFINGSAIVGGLASEGLAYTVSKIFPEVFVGSFCPSASRALLTGGISGALVALISFVFFVCIHLFKRCFELTICQMGEKRKKLNDGLKKKGKLKETDKKKLSKLLKIGSWIDNHKTGIGHSIIFISIICGTLATALLGWGINFLIPLPGGDLPFIMSSISGGIFSLASFLFIVSIIGCSNCFSRREEDTGNVEREDISDFL